MKKLMLIFIIALMLVSCGGGRSSPAGGSSSTNILLSNNADISSFAESMWVPVGGGTIESNATIFSFVDDTPSVSKGTSLYAMIASESGQNKIYYTNLSNNTNWRLASQYAIFPRYHVAYGATHNGAFYIGGSWDESESRVKNKAMVYMAGIEDEGALYRWTTVGTPNVIPGGVIHGFTIGDNGIIYLGISNANPAVMSSNINIEVTGSPWIYHGENPILSAQNPPSIMRNEYYNGYVYALLNNSEVYVSEGMKWYIVGGSAVGGGNHGAAQQTCMIGSKLYVATQTGNVYVTNLVSSPIGSNWALVGNASAKPSGNIFLLLTCDSVNSKVIATTYAVESSESSVINHVFMSNVSESSPQGTPWQVIGTPILPDRNKVISSIKVVNSDLYVGDGNGNVYVLNPEYAATIGGV